MEKIDCLFIHPPNLDEGFYKKNKIYGKVLDFSRRVFSVNNPIGGLSISFIPMGTFGIADLLLKSGYNCRIVHPGLETEKLGFLDNIIKNQPRVIAFDLQWSHSIRFFVKVLDKIKEMAPDSFIVTGGFTASFFYIEILKNLKSIDGVIRGDAEIPMLQLVRESSRNKRDLSDVSNLAWKDDNGKIRINKIDYVTSEKDLNELCFTNFKLLHNYKKYIAMDYISDNRENKTTIGTFLAPFGKGCSVNCSCCGGSKFSQKLLNNRTRVCFRSLKSSVEMLMEAREYGFRKVYIEFDPFPNNDKFYPKLFKKIKKERIECDIIFNSYGLPNNNLIKSYNKIKTETSFLKISPFCGSEVVRFKNRGCFYTNSQFMNIFKKLDNNKINFKTEFSTRWPFETIDDVKMTYKFSSLILGKFKYLKGSNIYPAQMDIGSLAFINPHKYRIRPLKKRFTDFYKPYNGFQLKRLYNYPAEEFTYYKSEKVNDLRYLLFVLTNRFKKIAK